MRWRAVRDDLSDVGPAVAWADSFAVAAGLPAALRSDVQVCVEEALANVILHGRAEGEKDIRLGVDAHAGRFAIVVSDRCAPFDVLAAELPAIDAARVGGAGLKLMRAFATEIRQARTDGRNLLTLTFGDASTVED